MDYKNAIVIGKFMDFHVGHEALINFAIKKSKKVNIFLCYTSNDRVDVLDRNQWIDNTFGNKVNIIQFDYGSYGLSGKEESDRDVSKAWASYIDTNYPETDVVIGSEDYIDYMAETGGFSALIFDKERIKYPCSSTSVNKGAFQYRAHESKNKLVKKIAFIGPESSGKSTAVMEVSDYFDLDFIEEAARWIMKGKSTFTYNDLEVFALQQQIDIINEVNNAESNILLVDSSAISTFIYSFTQFEKVSPIVQSIFENEKMELYLLFTPEVDFVQDGTRTMEDQKARELFFHRTKIWLEKVGLPHVIISGEDYVDRINQVKMEIIKLQKDTK